jgi:hypothetical protein
VILIVIVWIHMQPHTMDEFVDLEVWSDWNIREWIWTQALRFASDCEKEIFVIGPHIYYPIIIFHFSYLQSKSLFGDQCMRSIYSSSRECTWMHFLHGHLVMIHILHTAIFMLRKRLKHNHFRNTPLHL